MDFCSMKRMNVKATASNAPGSHGGCVCAWTVRTCDPFDVWDSIRDQQARTLTDRAHSNIAGSVPDEQLGHVPLLLSFPPDGCLVCLDITKVVSRADLVARSDHPLSCELKRESQVRMKPRQSKTWGPLLSSAMLPRSHARSSKGSATHRCFPLSLSATGPASSTPREVAVKT